MKPKTLKIPTPKSLENVAYYYLERFAASEASLRRVLENRVRRYAQQEPAFAHSEEASALRAAIAQIIERFRAKGILNDAAFAEIKVNALRRQGRSRRAILQKLGAKGIASELTGDALEKNADGADPDDIEYQAALAFARRRKLGSFRKAPVRDANINHKDMAAMARAGFSLDMAKRVLKIDPPEEAWE